MSPQITRDDNTMNFLTGYSSQLSTNIRHKLFKYRYDVFVKRLGWELDTPDGVEKDQFDHEDTLYVVAKSDNNDVVGCARLLPTTEPYLLEKVFPELLNGMEIPKSEDVWEISRFTNVSASNTEKGLTIGEKGQITELSFSHLLEAAVKCAKSNGAKHLISVSPVGIERLLRKAGVKSHRIGPPVVSNGHAIIACWIDID